MIILNRKRLLLITSFVFLSLVVCSVSNIKSPKTVETVALPVTNKVIIVDAGHGVPDERSTKQYWNHRSSNKFKNCS